MARFVLFYFPTVLWFFGFLEFHFYTLIFGPTQKTNGISVYLSLLIFLGALIQYRKSIPDFILKLRNEVKNAPFWFWLLLVFMFSIIGMGAFESRLPPHLMQETDAHNYHMALPHQHLMQGSLRHISWSVADLWPMPIQFGLAPAWFMTEYFQKIPQLIFGIWSFLLSIDLGRRYSANYWGWVPTLAVFSSHGVSMWYGNATLELVNFYFLIAFFHGFLVAPRIVTALHLSLFATAKAFNPLLLGTNLVLLALFYGVYRKKVLIDFIKNQKPLLAMTVLLTLLLLSRSAWVSLERSGTPLFPFASCVISSAPGCQGELKPGVDQAAAALIETRDRYGMAPIGGRGPISWIIHLWKISVPDWGTTTNAFVHPLGMAWVIWVVLCGFVLWSAFKKKELPSLFVVIALTNWAVWWIGSQQSRWLIPTLWLGWLGTIELQKKIRPAVLGILLVISASFSLISVVRAYAWIKNDRSVKHLATPQEITAIEKKKLIWDIKSGDIITQEVLYAGKPIDRHLGQNRAWIFENP